MKSWKVIIGVLCLLLFISGVVLAQTSLKTIPAQITVIEGLKKVEVYSDPECTHAINAITWTSVERGSDLRADFYIRNEGTESIDVKLQTTGDTSWGMITITPANASISNGEVAHFVCDISILLDAALGTHNFSFEVYE